MKPYPELDDPKFPIPFWFQNNYLKIKIPTHIMNPTDEIPNSTIHQYFAQSNLDKEKDILQIRSILEYLSQFSKQFNDWIRIQAVKMRDSIIKVKDAGKKAISMKSKFENEGKLPISINIKVSTKCCDPRLEQMLQAQHEESIKSIEKTLLQQKLNSIHLEVKLFRMILKNVSLQHLKMHPF